MTVKELKDIFSECREDTEIMIEEYDRKSKRFYVDFISTWRLRRIDITKPEVIVLISSAARSYYAKE